MRVNLEIKHWEQPPGQNPPDWAEKVPRWYQLDEPAYFLTELFQATNPEPENLVLSSPMSSNQTDIRFVLGGCESAQKFVHTLPNIRASMALQSLNQFCGFTCLPGDMIAGLEEFYFLSQEGQKASWASVHPLVDDSSLQKWTSYQGILISSDENGAWEMTETKPGQRVNDQQFQKQLKIQSNLYELAPYTLKRTNQ